MNGKFKVWDKKNKEWTSDFKMILLMDDGEPVFLNEKECCVEPDKNLEVVFYTGLKDKNKKEIYKNDIVKCNPDKIKVTFHKGNLDECWDEMVWPDMYSSKGEIFIVEWDKLTAGYKPFCKYDSDCGLYNYSKYFEIIGNMCENPELKEKLNNVPIQTG